MSDNARNVIIILAVALAAAAVLVALTIEVGIATRQDYARHQAEIIACTRIANPQTALACVESVTGQP